MSQEILKNCIGVSLWGMLHSGIARCSNNRKFPNLIPTDVVLALGPNFVTRLTATFELI